MIRLLEPWRTRLLWLSVGANLFATGLLAAPHLWPRRPPGGAPGFDRVVERMAHDLPPDDAAAFRAAMDRERPWYDTTRRRLDDARSAIAQQVAREPFDPAATRAAMATMQDRLREAATRFDDGLVEAIGTLSPAGRARLSDDLTRRRP